MPIKRSSLATLKRYIRILLTVLARLCAGLCAVAFVLATALALLLFNAEGQLFKSENYKQALQTTNMMARLPTLISQQLVSSLSGGPDQEKLLYLPSLTETDWEVLIRSLLPADLLRQTADQTLDQLGDYFDGKASAAAIPLVPFKQALTQKSLDLAAQVLHAQPHCTLAQLMDLGLQIASGKQPEQGALCDPPAAVTDTFLPLIDPAVKSGIAAIPDSFVLLDATHHPELLAQVGQARLLMRLSPLPALAFLLLMTLLGVRSRKGWLLWWGIPLALAGALGLLAGSLYDPIARLALSAGTASLNGYLGPLAGAVQELILAVARDVATPLMLESALILAAGIGMVVSARDRVPQPAA